MKFSPCIGQCTHEGTHCEGCGRTHEEVAETQKLIMDAVIYAMKKGYENPQDFANFVGQSIAFRLQSING